MLSFTLREEMKNKGVVRLLIFAGVLLMFPLFAKADQYSIPPSIRFTIERENHESSIVYYFSLPNSIDKSYPILVLCDGSTSKGDIGSVFFIRNYFVAQVESLGVGYLTVEQWGVDGNQIDEEEFWVHYTRSQRLKDHMQVIHHLEKHPPAGWNGVFIFVGVSEGGLLATDLSIMCPNTIATINWSGAGDWGWADELWQFFDHWKKNSFWIRLYDAIPRWIPFSSDIPSTRLEFDTLVQEIIANPTPHLRMGGMSYLYHADAFQTPLIDYGKIKTPFLVVAGAEDSIIDSCDQFVQKGRDAGAPITYFRVNGMDHYVRKRPDIIDKSFEWLKLQLSQEEMKAIVDSGY